MNQKSSATSNSIFLLIGWRNWTEGTDEGKFRRSCFRKFREGSGKSDSSFRKSRKVDVMSKS